MTRGAGALGVMAIVAACSEDYGTGQPSSPDASTGDAQAGDASPGSNLLSNGDFAIGCAGWQAVNGAAAGEDSTGHAGEPSCRLCVGPGRTDGAMYQKATSVNEAEEYAAVTWLRAPEGNTAATEALVYLEVYDASGKYLDDSPQNWLAVDETWKRATSLVTLKAGAAAINVTIKMRGGGCVLVDDAELTRL